MCCDRECQFCIDRNGECAENGTRIGGCMSFRPDLAIPEVAEAESMENTLQELADVDAEIAAMPAALAISFMMGHRPSGGPYEVTITDDSRWKNKDYKLRVRLVEHPDVNDEFEDRAEPVVLFDGRIAPNDIDKWIRLNDRRWLLAGWHRTGAVGETPRPQKYRPVPGVRKARA